MKTLKNNKGLTLVEVLISVLILMTLFVGTVYSFMKCVEASELSQNKSTAMLFAKNQLTTIEQASYSQIFSNYHGQTFSVGNLDGIGVTYVDASTANILQVKAVVCWKEKNGRTFGEDKNLNGSLDTGEDLDGNNEIDSIVSLTTVVQNI